MRLNRAETRGDRSNALWGRGSRGESRSNALWGRGGRRAGAAIATFVAVFALAASAMASGLGNGAAASGSGVGHLKAYVQASLLSSIEQNPAQTFDVIVEGDRAGKSNGLFQNVLGSGVSSNQVARQFLSIDGLHASLTGRQILFLAKLPFVQAVLPNESTAASSGGLASYNTQLWPWSSGVPIGWVGSGATRPTIAIVDSGIDATRSDFNGRVLGQVNLASLSPNSPGDGYGHGTAVAGIAAGSGAGYVGVSPRSKLISVDVMNDAGEATVADVIAGADWILANKDAYNIRVANFSLHAVNRASILFDPLDQAVEKLWLNGVVVVAAAGNYAVDGAESGVSYAPGNDPFVITVGAADINNTYSTQDDFAAPFSAWGYTPDGFAKPEIGAAGRHMAAPVSSNAAIYSLHPANVIAPGYMELSGTSFAAPLVAGAASEVLAMHPTWTPDQVKGALMVSARPTPAAAPGSLGVGEADVWAARRVLNPPNPNAGLDQYLTTDSSGSTVFDAAAWQSAALANSAWDAAAWSDAAWSSAAWSSAAWSDAAWADAAWASAAWGTAAWSDAAWSDAAWSDAAWSDGAAGDPVLDPTVLQASTDDVGAAASLLGIDPTCDPTVSDCLASMTTSP